MPNDDPWDWNIDRVVQELCTSNRIWKPRSAAGAPDPDRLATLLRHHEIDGPVLLTDIKDAELKEDLGLAKLAHKSFVRHAIAELRLKSVKYNEYMEKHPSDINHSAIEFHRSIQGLIGQVRSLHGSVVDSNERIVNHAENDVEEPAAKRRRLESAATNNDLPLLDSDVPEANPEKKRKRIAPTLITSEIDISRNRDIATAADDIVINTIPSPPPPPEPGIAFIGDDGKRHMVPMLQEQQPTMTEVTPYNDSYKCPLSAEDLNQAENSEYRAPKTTIAYLGKQSLPVDELFYSVPIGEEINSDHEDTIVFTFAKQHLPAGTRRYAHKRMQHFFNSGQHLVRNGDRKAIAIRPYPENLVQRFKDPSLTVFSIENGVPNIRRELANGWLKVQAKQADQSAVDGHVAQFNPLGPDFALNTSYDDWDPSSALEKYKYLDGGDEVLPLYGDSDSDNEYDAATWKEMEDEGRDLSQAPFRKSHRPSLSAEAVNDGIEEGIAQHVANWTFKYLPKLQERAWKFWMKSRKRQTKGMQIKALQMDRSHILQRLDNIRKGILSSEWTSKIQVIKQTSSMEKTVFAREELSWKIETLQQKTPPVKPSQISLSEQPQTQFENLDTIIDESQDVETLDVVSEISTDEDGLDEFVLPDESTDEEMIDDDDLVNLSTESEDEDLVVASARSVTESPEPATPKTLITTSPKQTIKASPAQSFSSPRSARVKNESSAAPSRMSSRFKIVDNVIDLVSSSSSDDTTPQKPIFIDNHGSENLLIDLVTPEKPKSVTGQSRPLKPLVFSKGQFSAIADDDSSDDEPISRQRRKARSFEDDEEEIEDDVDSPAEERSRKRKKTIVENADAREMRERDVARRKEQEERRAVLHAKWSQLAPGDENHGKIIVNDAAPSPPYLQLNDHIAQRIKTHQVDGLRFLWHSIIRDDKELQGCLLAHTMGLGKTMQTIALLVSIVDAATSEDQTLSDQIPETLRQSRTLILCPPTLINNWTDELITWVKPDNLLGEFRKVDSTMTIPTRLHTISIWYENGGILIMGYEMFRAFVENKKKKNGEPSFTEETHEDIMKHLVEGPNIVVADEAHKMKSAKAGLTKAASRFRTRCRIALTGSPLANNVMEYHTMIEWVAPNYLGPVQEFRRKYAEPIQEGLYTDSSPAEKRKALKMLGVLERDIGPKVQRATMTVLKNDLPQKTEFTITVALTDLQKEAYTLYVRLMTASQGQSNRTLDGNFINTTLWSWLAILSLLCNHPSTFLQKLKDRQTDTEKKSNVAKAAQQLAGEPSPEVDDSFFDLNANHASGASQELVEQEMALFKRVLDITDIALSNKAKILCQILDAATAAGDKTLVFTQSIPTLNYLEHLCKIQRRNYYRLDGSTKMNDRQAYTKTFNAEDNTKDIFLISTNAGGLGLNLQSANRVVIFDFKFNPIQEEQAIGRAYRIGQTRETFVYRFIAGGTFESSVHNKTIFKKQLASRVVDKTSHRPMAEKKLSDFLFEPKVVKEEDLSEFETVDPFVLDKILESQASERTICSIVQSDIFEKDDDEKLTAEEEAEVEKWHQEEKGRRTFGSSYISNHENTEHRLSRDAVAKLAGTFEPTVAYPPSQLRFAPNGAIKQKTHTPVYAPRPAIATAVNRPGPQPSTQRGISPVLGSQTKISTPPVLSKQMVAVGSANAVRNENKSPAIIPGNARSRTVTLPPPQKPNQEQKPRAPDTNTQGKEKQAAFPQRQENTKPSPSNYPRSKESSATPSHVSSRKGASPLPSSTSRNQSRMSSSRPQSPPNVEGSDMFQAMARKPSVQSLKIPVTGRSRQHHRSGSDRDLHRKSTVSADTSSDRHSSSGIATMLRALPDWARNKIAPTASSSSTSRRSERRSSSSSDESSGDGSRT